MNWLIIVAGGKGERMNLGFNKIFAKLGKLPLVYWTLRAFEKNPAIDNILISAREEDTKKLKSIIAKHHFKKVKGIVKSNSSRQDSTFLVLEAFKSEIKNDDLVGVHNGVNPFITDEEVKKVFLEAKKHGGALLAFPARDTVKISSVYGVVEKTPLRKNCWYAQTPQVSTFKNLWRAFNEAKKKRFIGTDDTQLLERIGIKPKIVPCSYQNIKITFPEDLVLAERILKTF